MWGVVYGIELQYSGYWVMSGGAFDIGVWGYRFWERAGCLALAAGNIHFGF